MQTVFMCGGRGTRLERSGGPKSLVPIAGVTLLDRLVSIFSRLHTSASPPVVIVDGGDVSTPHAIASVMPTAAIVRQPEPDGIANALLLAQPLLSDLAIVTLGDLFLDGHFGELPRSPALGFWPGAVPDDTSRNFGIAVASDGTARSVVEKPADTSGLLCGVGVYVLTPSTIAAFRSAAPNAATGERGITDAIQAAIDTGVTFRTIPFFGYYRNVNTRADLAAAEHYLARTVHE